MSTAHKKNSQSVAVAASLEQVRGLEARMAEVLREMEEKVFQLETLNSFSSLMNSSLDPAIVREKAMEATCQLLRCQTASLLVANFEAQELQFETVINPEGRALKKQLRLPLDESSIAGWVALHGKSLVLDDVQSDPRHQKRANASGFKTQTMVCVPLRTQGKVVGVLQAINKVARVDRADNHQRQKTTLFDEADLRLLETLGHQVSIAMENARLYRQVKKGFFETCEALAEAIEKKDRYTGGHTKRVVHYSMCIAKYLKLTPTQLENLRLSAILHDVGKIGIEDKILKKESQLSPDEWKVMLQHPDLGYDILKRVEGLEEVIGGMRHHHERWDGKGYPLALKGPAIPLMARIIAVADTFDAMVSTRPYRKGLDPLFAHGEIVKHSGTQFDPTVVEAFELAFQNEKMGRGSGGSRSSRISNCD